MNIPQPNRCSITRKVSCFSPSTASAFSFPAIPLSFLFLCSNLLTFASAVLPFSFPFGCLPGLKFSAFQCLKFFIRFFAFHPSWTCRRRWENWITYWTFTEFFIWLFRRSGWKTFWRIRFLLLFLPFIVLFCIFTAAVWPFSMIHSIVPFSNLSIPFLFEFCPTVILQRSLSTLVGRLVAFPLPRFHTNLLSAGVSFLPLLGY